MYVVKEVPNLLQLAEVLGCQIAGLPAVYLGLSLCGNWKATALWDLVVEHVLQLLASWKGQHLSKRGKLTLIKSVLSNFPVCFILFFRASMFVLQRIDKISREFLWMFMDGVYKFHLVDWDSAYSFLDQDGLGIKSLKEVNMAFLSKWLWRYGVALEAL